MQAGLRRRTTRINVHHLKAMFFPTHIAVGGIFDADAEVRIVSVVIILRMKIAIESRNVLRFAKHAFIRDFGTRRRIIGVPWGSSRDERPPHFIDVEEGLVCFIDPTVSGIGLRI